MDVCEPTQTSKASQGRTAQGRDQVSLMRTSVIIAMVMLLKAHLKSLYSLSEEYVPIRSLAKRVLAKSVPSKCNKFVIGKKSAIGDKPAVKRHENPLSWDRLPFAVTPIHTTHDAETQRTTVCLSIFLTVF